MSSEERERTLVRIGWWPLYYHACRCKAERAKSCGKKKKERTHREPRMSPPPSAIYISTTALIFGPRSRSFSPTPQFIFQTTISINFYAKAYYLALSAWFRFFSVSYGTKNISRVGTKFADLPRTYLAASVRFPTVRASFRELFLLRARVPT